MRVKSMFICQMHVKRIDGIQFAQMLSPFKGADTFEFLSYENVIFKPCIALYVI